MLRYPDDEPATQDGVLRGRISELTLMHFLQAGDAADRVEKLLQTVRKTIGLGAAGEQAARAAAAAATNHGPCV